MESTKEQWRQQIVQQASHSNVARPVLWATRDQLSRKGVWRRGPTHDLAEKGPFVELVLSVAAVLQEI